MLWQRPARTLTPSPAPSVPHGEALRLSALQASWKRDRWVARRRLAWRWLMWASWRCLIPAAAVMLFAWFILMPELGWRLAPAEAEQPPAPTVTQAIPAPPTAALPEQAPDTTQASPTLTDQPFPLPEPISAFTPHLKPENGLYSKEP